MLDLARKRIVLGMTGGIACYKIAELVRRMTEQGATVDVVMTEAATHFITPITMQALSGRPVFVDAWDARVPNNMAHIDLTRGADAVLIAPASTDFMAKLAHGLADDLLSTLCVARACPLLVVPAMNREMWANPATQRNAAQLLADGITLLGPAAGEQACGETGSGRMLEPQEILADLIAFFQPKLLAGRHVLLTAGPTSEPVDPVRVLTNRSSGKTGYALARAAREAGAQVTLVTGATALTAPRGVTVLHAMTAQQMYEAVMAHAMQADIFVGVAAVADWRVKNPSQQKLKKDHEGGGQPQMEFEPNPDILAEVARLPGGPWCVGFAAETEKLAEHAEAKRQRKGIPLLVGNLAHKVMDADSTELVLFDALGVHPLPAAPKLDAARRLIAEIAARMPT
ncbi:bifunctional phosphopantothenoylcysteine decarboxylase/phosphopantothenate--cysteine ligase CoaBC [Bordetella avium]|uniref:bifunctional phosphopantothenoylcysteine decarboxylase/phosphopantothenate--cysteine ligase CoaBC n=1 Tax=Bordetella avium TaxID=521 RepID=UPI000E694C18|nr:bifunctional phosphopantothenoylcysteine decarboxylase/phosphopantothenate--cysteine ligase CoaBC [Bordetella avium]AZY52190.1 bifunctional phosphopantothenoylcysteine decarboxylase/phosphopantothenate--cysteine ligase CoaBC [Bordetella avium]RIQ17991.1 bifunctional phosphopantothenoylcysteine decarboxylase/phosphopantothenate--cysteine ligase CoaBC [Bordetella avium]RIQ36466.1 bifunctional phosphopantothenoylcysteine decarboxylase/phosphopantothenate--cysteine ligase CoaBC [Bordetella avium]